MKILSFSAVEILPALLNKTKDQNVRPLFCNEIPCTSFHKYLLRFKVGEKVKLMWKQRSKYDIFCKRCGRYWGNPDCVDFQAWCEVGAVVWKPISSEKLHFPKLLGTGTITEVFEIIMYKLKDGKFRITDLRAEGGIDCSDDHSFVKKFSFRDGFEINTDMFKWFDKAYDLSTPKMFVVYRWKYDR